MRETICKFLALDSSALITYKLDISLEEARNLLKAAVDAEGTIFFKKRFRLRWLINQKFELSYTGNRNSWRRFLRGQVQENGPNTTLTARFEVSSFVAGFTMLWQFAASLIAIILMANSGLETIPVLILPLFGFALPHFGRFMSLKDEEMILKLLEKAFADHICQDTTRQ